MSLTHLVLRYWQSSGEREATNIGWKEEVRRQSNLEGLSKDQKGEFLSLVTEYEDNFAKDSCDLASCNWHQWLQASETVSSHNTTL